MEKIKVGVIFGGQSTEHDVSVVSGSSVIKNLNKEKYEIYPIYISKNGEWFHYIKPVQDIDIFEIGEQPKELEKISNEFETLKKQDIIFAFSNIIFAYTLSIQIPEASTLHPTYGTFSNSNNP